MITLGVIVGIVSYLIGVMPMLAFGLSSLLIGFLVVYLPESQEAIADRLASNLSLPPLLNMEKLLEDLELDERGIYIPASGLGVSPKVFVPLANTPATSRPHLGLTSSRRVFVTVGAGAEDRGVLLDPPGSTILIAIEQSIKRDFSTAQMNDAPDLLDSGLRRLSLAEVSRFEKRDSDVVVQVKLRALARLEERLRYVAPKLVAQIGTPIPSALAAAVSKTTGKYTRLKSTVLDSHDATITVNLRLET
jgi:hypothetical protein